MNSLALSQRKSLWKVSDTNAAIFVMSENGPEVLWHDFVEHEANGVNQLLIPMAMNYLSSLGFGHLYVEGCFELPAGSLSEYRVLLLCLRCHDSNSRDFRLAKTTYIQYALFIPSTMLQFLPSMYKMQNDLLKCLEGFQDLVDFSEESASLIKQSIYRSLTNYLE